MSSYFARSVSKAPAYLSPCLRPTLGRTLSNSSELSLASNCSGRSDDAVTSAPGTPTLESSEQPRHNYFHTHSHRSDSPALLSPRAASSSRPIAIDIPKIRKSSAGPFDTPDEPVSARGDLPGGYFPLHEDPRGRIHHPHPFQDPEPKSAPAAKPVTMRPHQEPSGIQPSSSMHSKATVSSYLAPGFAEYPLPVGKYYPTNYEQRVGTQLQQHHATYVSESSTSFSRSHDPSASSSYAATSDAHSRLQQYQRDMVAQTAMALSGTSKGASSPDARLNTPRKPIAPRLIPLGSPGPVTPMELEGNAANPFDKSSKSSFMAKENRAPPGSGYTAHSL